MLIEINRTIEFIAAPLKVADFLEVVLLECIGAAIGAIIGIGLVIEDDGLIG